MEWVAGSFKCFTKKIRFRKNNRNFLIFPNTVTYRLGRNRQIQWLAVLSS